MPARNIVKTYFENGFYHAYNRGVEKRSIFMDEQDHIVLLGLLKKYLLPSPIINKLEQTTAPITLNLHKEINLLAFCLMPNHFHLLLQQKKRDSMTKLLRRVATSYSIYFNNKYNRVGSLFQGSYKAVLIENENYLLHLSRYIHLNPTEFLKKNDLVNYRWSSYQTYLGFANFNWVKTDIISSYFNTSKNMGGDYPTSNTYQNFVENYKTSAEGYVEKVSID